jgi:hypothetical protein
MTLAFGLLMTPRRDSYPDDRTPTLPIAALEPPRRPSGFRPATRGSKETIDVLHEDVVVEREEATGKIPSAWGERLVAATVPREEAAIQGSVPKLAVAPEPPPPLPPRVLTPSAPHPLSTPVPPPISGPVSVRAPAPAPPAPFSSRPPAPIENVRPLVVGVISFVVALVVLGGIFVVAAIVRRHM